MAELFDRRKGRILTNEAYQQIGGAVGALANRADEIYRNLNDEAQELAHQMFMRLVTLGEGAEDTRRRATQSELLSLTDNTDLMEEIIDQFADYRLLSLDHDPETRQPTVEVAHEAILREWERLRFWLNESREEIRLQQQLTHASNEWRSSNKDDSFLLRGSRLANFEMWANETQVTLTQRERDFLQVSLEERERQKKHEAERQEREAAQEQRSKVLLSILVVVFALATIVSTGFGIFALYQQRETASALDVAQRSGLAFAANSALEIGEVDLAIALAIESVGDGDDVILPETRAVIEEVSEHGGPRGFYGNNGALCQLQKISIVCDQQSKHQLI